MIYQVVTREVHAHYYEVEADSPEDAKRLVQTCDESVDDIGLQEYCNTLDSDTWDIEQLG